MIEARTSDLAGQKNEKKESVDGDGDGRPGREPGRTDTVRASEGEVEGEKDARGQTWLRALRVGGAEEIVVGLVE